MFYSVAAPDGAGAVAEIEEILERKRRGWVDYGSKGHRFAGLDLPLVDLQL
jgi:hypothetical protein